MYPNTYNLGIINTDAFDLYVRSRYCNLMQRPVSIPQVFGRDDFNFVFSSPRNSPSLLNVMPSDIHNFAIAHNMRLDPTKCKEMYFNFLRNCNCLINPIIIGGNIIKSVNTYKILGVIMPNGLKWNSHVDYIIKKACKKLYSLRVLRMQSEGVPTHHLKDIP